MLPSDWGPVYRLGRVVMTPGARARVPDGALATALQLHARKVWGQPAAGRRRRHLRIPLSGCRFLTVGHADNRLRFLVVTEADRRFTVVMLPEECRVLGPSLATSAALSCETAGSVLAPAGDRGDGNHERRT